MGRENDVVGSKILAFVELDTLAQMKAPMQGIYTKARRARLGLGISESARV
jgi:hypothetical protein